MSRCYPYPPPGYQKKASADQPLLDLTPPIQVTTQKEKHKHKDKEKKKKRKREEKDDNAHKEKRSSKNHKAAHPGVVHPGENGRVAEPSACADNGQEGAVKASGAPERDSRTNRDRARLPPAGLQDVREASAPERESRPNREKVRVPSAGLPDVREASAPEYESRPTRDGARLSSAGLQDVREASAPELESRPNRDAARLPSAGFQDARLGVSREAEVVGVRITSREAGKQDVLHEPRISSTSLKASPREVKGPVARISLKSESQRISTKASEASRPVGKEVKPSVSVVRASSASTLEVKSSGSGSAGKLQECSNARPVPQEARKSSDKSGKQRGEKPVATASTSKYVVVDKEINGKVPSLRTPAEQDQQRQQQEQFQRPRQPQVQDRRQASVLPLPHAQPSQQHQQQQQQQPREGPPQQQAKEAQQQKERSSGGGDSEKRESGSSEKRESGSSEKREKRSRLAELKLPEVPAGVNNTYDDDYLEWLFPDKRRAEVKRENERAESSRGDEEVWGAAVYIPSVDVIALPYVVPY